VLVANNSEFNFSLEVIQAILEPEFRILGFAFDPEFTPVAMFWMLVRQILVFVGCNRPRVAHHLLEEIRCSRCNTTLPLIADPILSLL
jgi:hypothetical protein